MSLVSFDPAALVGPSTAARMLGISRQHVLRLASAGKLTPAHTELGRLFERAEVERLAEERAETAA